MDISQADKLDEFDQKILEQLQTDCRQSFKDLAENVGLSAAPCWRRVQAMETKEVILGYRAVIDPEKVGLAVMVFLNVTLDKKTKQDVERFEKAVEDCPEVVECYEITGGADYLLKILVRDIKTYRKFLLEYPMQVRGVRDVESRIVLHVVKPNSKLPIQANTNTKTCGHQTPNKETLGFYY